MNDSEGSTGALETLRAEIDRIDDQLLTLIQQRVACVNDIARAKQANGGRPGIRPGREAMILRRLLAGYDNALPVQVVVRIWRELISAFCRFQSPYSVAVVAPEKSVGYWDLARSHYGTATPTSLHRSQHVVLSTVSADSDVVGILPWPCPEGDEEPWWIQLVAGGERTPQIIAKLPFLEPGGGRFEDLSAMAVANVDPEPSGDDITLAVAVTREQVSRARFNTEIERAGIPGHCIDSRQARSGGDWMQLIEIDGFVERGDPRLEALQAAEGADIERIVVLGAYAKPLH
ncbi:chorismate mutase [Oceanibacterium hippocampi]|uniref:chorismate mutase n=1 Tax=Oceanibacterium hippocampi TaxID=745714 RepID=UPI0015937C81|nr:chorismate mutase [Oceanibacterium hippocampi]